MRSVSYLKPLSATLTFNLCLIAVGGLVSPVKGPYAEPLYFPDKPPDAVPLNTSCCEEEEEHKYATVTTAKKAKKLGEDNEGKAESKHCPMVHPIMLMSEPGHKKNDLSGVPELELSKLEHGEDPHSVPLSSSLLPDSTLLIVPRARLQISTWIVCLSFTLLRCRSNFCLAWAASRIPTGNHGKKR